MSGFLNGLKILLFPPKCIKCGSYTKQDECLCEECREAWEKEKTAKCNKCGQSHVKCNCPIKDESSRLFGVFHLAEYKKDTLAADLVYKIKDGEHSPVNNFLAEELYERLKDRADFSEALVTYVPRRREAINKYGSDQAYELARELCRISEKEPVKLIVRKGKMDQKALNFEQRHKNVRNSYFIYEENAELIKGKRIFIVDDIITTGATVSHLAELLLERGAVSVSAVSVARRT